MTQWTIRKHKWLKMIHISNCVLYPSLRCASYKGSFRAYNFPSPSVQRIQSLKLLLFVLFNLLIHLTQRSRATSRVCSVSCKTLTRRRRQSIECVATLRRWQATRGCSSGSSIKSATIRKSFQRRNGANEATFICSFWSDTPICVSLPRWATKTYWSAYFVFCISFQSQETEICLRVFEETKWSAVCYRRPIRQPVLTKSSTGIGQFPNRYWPNWQYIHINNAYSYCRHAEIANRYWPIRQPVLTNSPTGIGQFTNRYWPKHQPVLAKLPTGIDQIANSFLGSMVGDFVNTGCWFGQYRLANWPIPVGELVNTGWRIGQYRLAISAWRQ